MFLTVVSFDVFKSNSLKRITGKHNDFHQKPYFLKQGECGLERHALAVDMQVARPSHSCLMSVVCTLD